MMLLLAISIFAGLQMGNASRYGYKGDAFDRVGSFACKRSLQARIPPLRPGEHYRGELDLLPGIYSAIALVGIEKVVFWPLPQTQPVPARPKGERPRRRRMSALHGQ